MQIVPNATFNNKWEVIKTWLPSLVLLPVCAYYIHKYPNYSMLDNFHLIVHEAGHFFFMFFGNYVHALGGTLMQIIIPIILMYYFYYNRMTVLLQATTVLLGHSFLNIAVYASDARARVLPLLGNGKHDWFYLLGELGLLEYDNEVGILFFSIGILIFIFALITPLLLRN